MYGVCSDSICLRGFVMAIRPIKKRLSFKAFQRAVRLEHIFAPFITLSALSFLPKYAFANETGLRMNIIEGAGKMLSRADTSLPIGLVTIGVTVFAATISLMHIRARTNWQKREASQQGRINELEVIRDRSDLYLNLEPQVIISWNGNEPTIIGDLSIVLDAPIPRRILGFSGWLPAEQARALELSVDQLRENGTHFKLTLKASNGHHIEAEGHAISGCAVMRLRDVSGDRLALLRLEDTHMRVSEEANALKTLLNTAPQAAWLRDKTGAICWVNAAYADAVEAGDPGEAIARKIELLEQATRQEASKLRNEGKIFKARVQTVIAGKRRKLDVIETPTTFGSVGIIADMTEVENVRADLNTQREAHIRTLNHLPLGIASFDRTKRLTFYNQAYVDLWKLDEAFLKHQPSDGDILDKLRAAGQLPVQADFKSWKTHILDAYRSTEAKEFWWSLPDGRHLRVVANPNPLGGITYLFDDLTERYSLQTRVQSMSKVQDETLDSLRDGVAVFGSDGRLKLGNPAFAELFDVDRSNFGLEPHIDAVINACKRTGAREAWQQIRTAITGFNDERMPTSRRLMIGDIKIDATTIPLSDGATLVNFVDVSVNARIENALRERNDALENASRFKTSFIKNVSFELRSPLTSVIGFGQALAAGTAGALTDKQQDYAHHIMQSSEDLLTLIDDILDIASIDAGTLELEPTEVNLQSIIDQTILDLKNRILDNHLHIDIAIKEDVKGFFADARRLRQILYNLLSNSIDFSRQNATISILVLAHPSEIILHVKDMGQASSGQANALIRDPQLRETESSDVEPSTKDVLNRGAGLRLSVVRSLVELHGGKVRIISSTNSGTEVISTFPREGYKIQVAAE
jgi:signal transduction histidine kinase